MNSVDEAYKALALTLLKSVINNINKGKGNKTDYNFLESKLGQTIIDHFGIDEEIYKVCPKYYKWKLERENGR